VKAGRAPLWHIELELASLISVRVIDLLGMR
jgi:hypothetical protein